ncbi:PE-PGRS family protein, triacylglycerol lipase LipY (esterase/lipase) (triglyceride lipase) (tributyrase) [Mycobacterium tuberculosis H37Rv] [Mycobacterium shimoidei]|uniref:PE-PGRS family protein, triacylglycerol lipase LipY (Esterase/lipase) (Triglyceride lipase) (Tributyrase) [Mycobacterium tuberculosis H37Rv] n=1 Tax=Mycobacterium shimoidei TaxID=29313 RepID=A0A375Z3N0_MYCSH|nr:PE domain-containing protein [Mycobacterium shimoidei]SRX95773.1 PE-PGRS family protein, triacylglycerol lipase LipY (esterase/lipase) (triglyceride lipase) (tributyrase) [Mycobacterium tuberculosis H37Rv] [Mycobacterium shimoidei]
MSFVTTQPQALTAAGAKLQNIGSAMFAANAAAAALTTNISPAAADEVSVLQATQFSAYGALYQQISTQATAIHEMFVHALGTSANSYDATEAANSAVAESSPLGTLASLAGNIFNVGPGNIGSAASDLLELGALNWSTAPGTAALSGTDALGAGLGGAVLTGAAGPAGRAGLGGVLAGVGEAPSVGGLSVPPSWTGMGAPGSSPVPATLAGGGWTSAAPESTRVATMPAGMPAVASAGRGNFGFGAPRYGCKPTVMPKSAVV